MLCLLCMFSLVMSGEAFTGEKQPEIHMPNIILMMADDLGYGDTGFNGNTIIKTPNLDSLSEQGVVLTRFYAGNSVCSPTRATCLTGATTTVWGFILPMLGICRSRNSRWQKC